MEIILCKIRITDITITLKTIKIITALKTRAKIKAGTISRIFMTEINIPHITRRRIIRLIFRQVTMEEQRLRQRKITHLKSQ